MKECSLFINLSAPAILDMAINTLDWFFINSCVLPVLTFMLKISNRWIVVERYGQFSTSTLSLLSKWFPVSRRFVLKPFFPHSSACVVHYQDIEITLTKSNTSWCLSFTIISFPVFFRVDSFSKNKKQDIFPSPSWYCLNHQQPLCVHLHDHFVKYYMKHLLNSVLVYWGSRSMLMTVCEKTFHSCQCSRAV